MSSITVTKSFDFSVEIVKLCFEIQKNRKEYVLTRQLIRSATSVAANLEEAQGAFSKADFIFKIQLSLKEARETSYWLRLIKATELFAEFEIEKYITTSNELVFMTTKILKTSKENHINNNRT